jgi:hypothetical protein
VPVLVFPEQSPHEEDRLAYRKFYDMYHKSNGEQQWEYHKLLSGHYSTEIPSDDQKVSYISHTTYI